MSLGAGNPLEDLRPLTPEGNRDMTEQVGYEHETIGCHAGRHRMLNVVNPQPNYEYKWINDKPEEILAARQKGEQIVQAEDPEYSAVAVLSGLEPTDLDSGRVVAGVRLVRVPMKVVRRREAERQALHDRRFKSGEAERAYLDKSNQYSEEARLREIAGGDVRLIRKDHGTSVTSGPSVSDRRVDGWRPQLGIDSDL